MEIDTGLTMRKGLAKLRTSNRLPRKRWDASGPVSIVVTGARLACQRQTRTSLPTLYMLLWAHAAGAVQLQRWTAPVSSGCSRPSRRVRPRMSLPRAWLTARPGSAWPETSSNSSVRRLEIIEEIGPGLAFMPKHHAAGTQRCPGQRHALGPAVRAAALSYIGDWQDSRRGAEIQCENGEVVSCTPRCAVLLQRATG